MDAVLPVLNVRADVKEDIRDAVAVGKIATVSQNNITVGGWTGVGYIISDPDTGTGAYMISGGANGGEFNIDDINWDPLFAALYAAFFAIGLTLSVLPLILMVAIIGDMIIAGVAVVTSFLAWMVIRTHLPSDSIWRIFLADIFGGLFIGILGLMITGLTLTFALVAIALIILYTLLDVFAPSMAFLLFMTRKNRYA